MKELNKKVFKILFLILSLFIISGVIIYNVRVYTKEYDNIKRNLDFMPDNKPGPNSFDKEPIDNMIIMDYEVYTVKIKNNNIDEVINHSNNTSNIDIEKISKKIISKDKGSYIGNLYNSKYSYNYKDDTITIINTKSITNRLLFTLLESIIILLIFEIIIYYVSKKLTKRITRPAKESFNKQKDFIADASHELKTPLAVIMASADELKETKANKKYIDNIKYESNRMNNLIKNLLDLSKLENGVSISNKKAENISNTIERISLTFDSIAYENNLKIESNIDKDIMFKCSKEEIEKLISIILDNAIKHSYKDTTINIDVFKNKNNINIEITNIGDPIDKDKEDKIFERFYRIDKSRNRDNNRYGLGLSIAKNIVNNHNGIIKANSKNNKTTFTIILKK
ncbi:MAG: HAMP domain-containing histidine kinase [Bacilli bacterium]|nr:HAMP domain-containing histidine kinase [Bacilli bacterium]